MKGGKAYFKGERSKGLKDNTLPQTTKMVYPGGMPLLNLQELHLTGFATRPEKLLQIHSSKKTRF